MVAALLNGDNTGAARVLARLGPILEVSPYLVLFPERPCPTTPMVGLVRDGRATVRSGMLDGWYYHGRREQRHWSRLQPEFGGSRFENCCRFWAWCYERLSIWQVPIFRLEDIVRNSETRVQLCREVDVEPIEGSLPRRNRDSLGKLRFRALGVGDMPRYPDWSRRDKGAFREIAGPTMDRFYPGWELS
jgi:hypothetical protein